MVPKFRAWDGQDMVMRDVEQLRFAHNSNNHVVYITIDGEEWETGPALILMQSTGLKDKNGVEIFEGDIVRWHDVVTWDYSVTFKDGVFCISDDPSSNFYHLKEDINGKFEVIGNIYENPELLEQANES